MGYIRKRKFRFLIPAKLGDCEILPSLSDLQTVDISKPTGMLSLKDTILEDWNDRIS
jgi:hypothetical protein